MGFSKTEGRLFGELSLEGNNDSECLRTASIISCSMETHCLFIPKSTYCSAFKNIVLDKEKQKMDLIKILCPDVEITSQSNLQMFLQAFEEEFESLKGRKLSQEGDPVDSLYLIVKGKIELTKCFDVQVWREMKYLKKEEVSPDMLPLHRFYSKINFNSTLIDELPKDVSLKYPMSLCYLSEGDFLGEMVINPSTLKESIDFGLGGPTPLFSVTASVGICTGCDYFRIKSDNVVKRFPPSMKEAICWHLSRRRELLEEKFQKKGLKILQEVDKRIGRVAKLGINNYVKNSKILEKMSNSIKKDKIQRNKQQMNDQKPVLNANDFPRGLEKVCYNPMLTSQAKIAIENNNLVDFAEAMGLEKKTTWIRCSIAKKRKMELNGRKVDHLVREEEGINFRKIINKGVQVLSFRKEMLSPKKEENLERNTKISNLGSPSSQVLKTTPVPLDSQRFEMPLKTSSKTARIKNTHRSSLGSLLKTSNEDSTKEQSIPISPISRRLAKRSGSLASSKPQNQNTFSVINASSSLLETQMLPSPRGIFDFSSQVRRVQLKPIGGQTLQGKCPNFQKSGYLIYKSSQN